MPDTVLELNEDEFDAQFPLVTNHFDPHASWAFDDERGCLFGTHGAEIRFVSEQDPRTVWTLVDTDGDDQAVISGFHFVNRVGYLVSKVPVPEGVLIEVRIPGNTIDNQA